MNKPIYETIKIYGSNSELSVTKRIVGYERVTRNGLSRKKKPISMIKALEVRDKMERRKVFYNSETWKEIHNKNLPELTPLLTEVGGGTLGKISVTNLETGEKRWI
ncbi:hypothetical protein [Lactococcus lactis]|uniref:hypothetical protein n=1 Tax=Lactococcus lactis TaxID=1358 RepID=UPI003DA83688